MSIKESKARRSELWARLKAITVELHEHPLSVEERGIRGELKEIQDSLYKEEMTPVFYDLKKKLSEDVLQGEKLEAAQAKYDVLKGVLGIE